jgi:uncharacterized phage infection (PIP) family protein YhgE
VAQTTVSVSFEAQTAQFVANTAKAADAVGLFQSKTERMKAGADAWTRGLATMATALDPVSAGFRKLQRVQQETAAAAEAAAAKTSEAWTRGLARMKSSLDPFEMGMRRMQRQQAELAAAGAGIAGAGKGLSVDGLKKAENAIFNLAGAATGLQGPLGKLAEFGLIFAVGGPWAVAIAGGIALVVGAYKMLGGAADEVVKRQSPLRDQIDDLAKAWKSYSVESSRALLTQTEIALKTAESRQKFLESKRQRAQGGLLGKEEMEELRGLNTDIKNTFEPAWLQAFKQFGDLTASLKDKGEKGAKGLRAVREELLQIQSVDLEKIWAGFGKAADDLERLRAEADKLRRQQSDDFYDKILPQGLPDLTGIEVEVPKWLVDAQRQAAEWQGAWMAAMRAVEDGLANVFMAMFQTGSSFIDRLKASLVQLLRQLQQIFAQLLARQIIGAIGGAAIGGIGGGGGSVTGVDAIPMGGGLALRQGAPVTVTNVFNVSALDARGVQDVILENYGAVTAATMRGLSESRMASMALGIR